MFQGNLYSESNHIWKIHHIIQLSNHVELKNVVYCTSIFGSKFPPCPQMMDQLHKLIHLHWSSSIWWFSLFPNLRFFTLFIKLYTRRDFVGFPEYVSWFHANNFFCIKHEIVFFAKFQAQTAAFYWEVCGEVWWFHAIDLKAHVLHNMLWCYGEQLFVSELMLQDIWYTMEHIP